jgi:amidase
VSDVRPARGTATPRREPAASSISRRTFLVASTAITGMAAIGVAGACSRESDRAASAPMTREPSHPRDERRATSVPIWALTAAELARRIRNHELSSREVVDAFLERINTVNGDLNAVTRVLSESARAAAESADERLERGTSVGPLHGVPITVKENIDLQGSPTTMGLPAFAEMVPEVDAPHVAKLRAAGAIPIARSNLPDLAFRWHTQSRLHGPTVNPWDATRSPGGSSGGDAVAVATGMTPVGIGNDYFGSLRVPAQFCGIAALRPTMGRIASASSLLPDPPISMQLMAVQGPMARSVGDLRIALAVMAEADPRDPWWTAAPQEGDRANRRVAVHRVVSDPHVAAGVDRAADALADAGYELEDVSLPLVGDGSDIAQDLVAADAGALADPLRAALGSDARNFIDAWLGLRPALDRAGYAAALMERHRVARAWSEFQSRFPLVLTPVSTARPFLVGSDLGGGSAVAAIFETMRLVVLVNLLGLPAVAVPTGAPRDLPQGVQIIGPRFREDLCLDAAEVVQEALGVPVPIGPH